MDAGPIDEVAQEFGITRRTLYRLIKQHQLQTYRRTGDRRTYVDRSEIRPYVELHPSPVRRRNET
ncbi:MAG: helix-turn-helix transcriptional regulator [Candidatus Dormibacteraceae bacterium]